MKIRYDPGTEPKNRGQRYTHPRTQLADIKGSGRGNFHLQQKNILFCLESPSSLVRYL